MLHIEQQKKMNLNYTDVFFKVKTDNTHTERESFCHQYEPHNIERTIFSNNSGIERICLTNDIKKKNISRKREVRGFRFFFCTWQMMDQEQEIYIYIHYKRDDVKIAANMKCVEFTRGQTTRKITLLDSFLFSSSVRQISFFVLVHTYTHTK